MKITSLLRSQVLLSIIALAVSSQIHAIDYVQLKPGAENRLDVTESSYLHLQVANTFSTFGYLNQETTKGSFAQIYAKGYSKSTQVGDPELPVMSRLIEVPVDAVPEIRIVSYTITDYDLSNYGVTAKIFPLQPPHAKNASSSSEFAYNTASYQQNKFLGGELAKVEIQGFLRGVRLANLIISPVQYNPVTNTLRVYENLVVDVRFTGANIAKTREMRSKFDSPYFHSIFNKVINLQPVETDRDTIMKMPVKYVIVSPPMFHDALQPLVQWKTRKGFTVVQAYTDNPAVGTTFNSIKAYLQGLYTNSTAMDPAPSFVLFVGDVDQVPSYNCGSHVSDLYYCEYSGDFLPEVYYGRFSATNLTELQPQINKTLEYEQYQMPDPSYLNECVMVAGADASYGPVWGNGQINYGTNYYFNPDHGLTSHTYLQPEPAGGNYATNIHTNVSNGVCYANYTAHGSEDGWADPSFTIADVANLQNAHKYPLMVGNCCLTNRFDVNCFGEALLRAQDKGALAYIGGTNVSYWDEDFYWGVGVGPIVVTPTYEENGLGAYDRTFHDHGEPMEEWYSTTAQMIFAGNLAVQESTSSMKQYYWEIYALMGDPSLMVYFSVPPAMTVDYTPLLPLGSPIFSVHTEPYAYVAISKNNVLHGAVEADATGLANIQLMPFTEPGYATVVITKQNRQPYIDSVMVASPDGPYLVLDNYLIKDQGGNNNQVPEFGEPLTMDLSMKNFGNSDAINTLSTLSTTDPYVSVTAATHTWPVITSNGSASATDAFIIQAHDYVPDLHTANFTLTSVTDTNTFSSGFNIQFLAPALSAGIFTLDEATGGNGNGQLDPGETIYVTIPTSNTGHCTSSALSAQLFVFGDYITINTPAQSLPALAPGGTVESTFSFTISPDAPLGTEFSLYFTVTAGPYNAVSSLFPTVGPQIEDYETNNFSRYSWRMTGNQGWKISPTIKSQGNFGSQSGTLGNSQRSEMYLDVIVLSSDTISFYRKVSSESGYDYLKFYLDGVEMGKWSGTMDWARVSYPVLAGPHRFSWAYETDESTLSGQNAGWIDYIVFPPFSENPTGPLAINMLAIPPVVCPGSSSQLYAFATGGSGNYAYSWSPAATLNNDNTFNPVATPVENTFYHVIITSGLFTSSSDIEVTLGEIPSTPVVTLNGDHFESSAATGNQWYNSQGIIAGATDQIYKPEHTDSYYTIVTNQNGCSSQPSDQIYYGFVGVKGESNQGFHIYPNPFEDKFFLDYTLKTASSVKIAIYDAIGNEAMSMNLGQKAAGTYKLKIDGSKLATGIYYCKLYTGNEVLVTKVIRNN
ncbi:MAG: T9SS type A sorting domain-containing protein [Bacteroidetes bacterium]|nr:T9SS type A sorting domain-containing protein [Bacteroidota bacterium]